jgi:hypothetical protein
MPYVIRPRSVIFDNLQGTPLLEARVVTDSGPMDTGLVNKDGDPIMRVMLPIGFTELKERG